MATTLQIQSRITLTNNDDITAPKSWNRDCFYSGSLTRFRGPSPGLVVATPAGVSVSLAALTDPGPCVVTNLGAYRCLLGIKDTSTGNFYPMFELPVGGSFALPPLARDLESELSGGTGTGTAGSGATLYIKSIGGSCDVSVEAFDGNPN